MPRLHTESDLDILYMVRNIISRCFQWQQAQAQIHPDMMWIVQISWRPGSVLTLRLRLLVFGSCIVLGPIRGTSRGFCTTLETLLAAAIPLLGFGFCLDYSVKNSFAAVSVCETPTLRLIFHLQSHFNWAAFFQVLACVLRCSCRD